MSIESGTGGRRMPMAANTSTKMSIFLPGLYGGGAQRALLKLAGGIAERGYDVDLVLSELAGPFVDEIPEMVRVVDLHVPRTAFALPALVRYLRREEPQALLSALNYVNLVALWARRLARVPTRLVVSQRNTLSYSYLSGRSASVRGNLMRFLIKRCYPWADGIVAVSGGVADDLAVATGIARTRIQVIYNPIVTPELEQLAQAPLDHPWFGPGQPPVILAVGSLTAQKDFVTLIRAFGQVRQRRQARLLILGEGKERIKLESLIRELNLEDAVSLPGFVKNPYPYMAHAAAFALSSRWEGLPGVLIEALYARVPIVATDCPSGPREVLAEGVYGRLVPVGDAGALADALDTTLEGQSLRPPSASWRPFEKETVVSQYLGLLLGG